MLKYISLIGIAFSVGILYETTFNKMNQGRSTNSIGRVIHPKNDTRLKEQGMLHWQHVREDANVHSGDTIFTGENSSTNLALVGGSQINMSPNSIVILRDDVLDLETGNLRINFKGKEKIKFIRVAGKHIPLEKTGQFNIIRKGETATVEYIPETAGAKPIMLLQEAPALGPVEPMPQPVQPMPEPKKVALIPRPAIRKEEPIIVEDDLQPELPPEAAPMETEMPAPRPKKKGNFYAMFTQGDQEQDVSVKGSSQTYSNKYKLSGSSIKVRAEIENLFKRPVAFTIARNSYTGSEAKFSGLELGAELLLKSQKESLKDFTFMPGVYFRTYTLEMENIIPTETKPSEVSSNTAMLSFATRWEKKIGENWVAEVWPGIKATSKDGILMDYNLLAAFGRNTKYGRFSLAWNWSQYEDLLPYTNTTEDGDATIKTTENRLGLMYHNFFEFDYKSPLKNIFKRKKLAKKVAPTERQTKKPRDWAAYVMLAQGTQEQDVSVKGSSQTHTKSYNLTGNSLLLRGEVENVLKRPVAFSITSNNYSASDAKYSGLELGSEMIFKPVRESLKNFVFMPGVYFRTYNFEMEDIIPTETKPSEVSSSTILLSLASRWEKKFAENWVAELWPGIKVTSKNDILTEYNLLAAIGRNTNYGRFSLAWRYQQSEDFLPYNNTSDDGDATIKTKESKIGLLYFTPFEFKNPFKKVFANNDEMINEPVQATETEDDIPPIPKESVLYASVQQVSQNNTLEVDGSSQNSSKDYDLTGTAFTLRGETKKLFRRPVAINFQANNFSASDATYAGYDLGMDLLYKSDKEMFKNFTFMPGLILRRYTFELEDILQDSNDTSDITSTSAIFNFGARWEKDFGKWTTELWPGLGLHYRDGINTHYGLMGGVGRNTKFGRFSFVYRWQIDNDVMEYADTTDSGSANIKTTESRMGLMYRREF